MTDADNLRALLARAGLSQRGAARELGIDERTVRKYCAGDLPVPRVVWLALETVERAANQRRRNPMKASEQCPTYFERRGAGKRYVYARWRCPRKITKGGVRCSYCETPQEKEQRRATLTVTESPTAP